jgi:hypothetical protein
MPATIYDPKPDRFRLCAPVVVQDGRAMLAGFDPARLIAERYGVAEVEDAGGGEKSANYAEVTVVFSRRV